jgi:uncharacterized membrane protein
MFSLPVFLGVSISLLILDIFWLSTMAKRLYRPELGNLIADKFRPIPAVIFYIIYVFGIMYFASSPAIHESSGKMALINGAILGAISYSTYDLTNAATLQKWSLKVTIIDIIWGATLTAMSSYAGYYAHFIF